MARVTTGAVQRLIDASEVNRFLGSETLLAYPEAPGTVRIDDGHASVLVRSLSAARREINVWVRWVRENRPRAGKLL